MKRHIDLFKEVMDDKYLYYIIVDGFIKDDNNLLPKVLEKYKLSIDNLSITTLYSIYEKGYLNTFGITTSGSFGINGIFNDDYKVPYNIESYWYTNRFEYLVYLGNEYNSVVMNKIKKMICEILRDIKINELV